MIKLNRKNGRIDINLIAIEIGKDLCIILTGGEEHIGSITVGTAANKSKNIIIEGHKEHVLTRKIGEILTQQNYWGNFVICCGIHFDDITIDEIEDVMSLSCDMIEEMITKQKERLNRLGDNS